MPSARNPPIDPVRTHLGDKESTSQISEFGVVRKEAIVLKQRQDSVSKIADVLLALSLVLVETLSATHSSQAQTFKVLHAFKGSPDGAEPYAGSLILDDAGNIYGTTINGGDSGNGTCVLGCGTVFKIGNAGKETVLYRFRQVPDGNFPSSGLIRDASGDLYGTTYWGGTSNSCGTVFKISKTGAETVLYSFAGGTSDGCYAQGALFRDVAGNFFGTTEFGIQWGTVFELTESGQESTIHIFAGSPDGTYPVGNLIQDAAGSLYGATQNGGTTGCTGNEGCGTVFKIDPTGKETVLYRFTGGKDGAFPQFGSLVLDSAGNLYGMTFSGGLLANDCITLGCGVVFKLDPKGKETVLYRFTGGRDGASPQASVVRDSAGNLYGTTQGGGDLECVPPYGCGTVFKLDKAGKLTVLHRFAGGDDGYHPLGGVILDKAGNVYGTTTYGGAYGNGVVFKITP